jgi:hypothetical protein
MHNYPLSSLLEASLAVRNIGEEGSTTIIDMLAALLWIASGSRKYF